MVTAEIPASIRSDPTLLFLYQRVEAILGIRAAVEPLVRLKDYLEERCGASYSQDPLAHETILESREELFVLAPFITVNETYFFREGVHFRLLSQYFLPLLAQLKRPVRICSAATSSGCEAYSIAMVMDFFSRGQEMKHGGSFFWELDAFDLNGEVIDIARRGRYTPNALREDGSEWKFLMDLYIRDADRDFEVSRVLRDKVRFFTHNVMEGLTTPGLYDIIFFRNALIYFSPENRQKILDILINSLTDGGILIVGVSETAAVEDPRLEMVHRMESCYFKKCMPGQATPPAALPRDVTPPRVEPIVPPVEMVATKPVEPREAAPPPPVAPVGAGEIVRILEQGDGNPNAERVVASLREAGVPVSELGGAELIAAALSLINAGDSSAADLVLSFLEKRGSSPAISFLRGEFYYRAANAAAEEKYQEAMVGDTGFWPAFYRISSLAEDGNRTRYEYRLKRALESMEKGAGLGYEIFIGGFSPDYYRRILERKLAE